MKTLIVAAAAAAAALVVAGSALAANTATVAVSTAGTATTIHAAVPQTTDPIAVVTFFVPTGYTANLSAAPNTGIGSVDATALSHDTNLTLPLSGPVTTDNPVAPASDPCSPGTHAAIWNLNLSVAGQTLVVKTYVDPTTGAAAALGAYQLRICLPPWDVPLGTPGRAFQGAQLLDSKLTLNNVFTAPSGGGIAVWHTLFTPYNPGQGTVNLAGTFEARSLWGAPALSLKVAKANGKFVASGKATEGGAPAAGVSVVLLRGSAKAGSATTGASGTWSVSGKFTGKKPILFKATATAKERDATAQGCATPLPATVAPGGCATATLGSWTVSSPVVKFKP
jgi:hypothetical protein